MFTGVSILPGRDLVLDVKSVSHVLREILKGDSIHTHQIWCLSFLCVNFTHINQCNLIWRKKVNVNILL